MWRNHIDIKISALARSHMEVGVDLEARLYQCIKLKEITTLTVKIFM